MINKEVHVFPFSTYCAVSPRALTTGSQAANNLSKLLARMRTDQIAEGEVLSKAWKIGTPFPTKAESGAE
jgi:hypothetical protein